MRDVQRKQDEADDEGGKESTWCDVNAYKGNVVVDGEEGLHEVESARQGKGPR